MSPLVLRELGPQDEAAFIEGSQYWLDELSWYTFVWQPGMSHDEHLKILQDEKDPDKIPAQRVPSSMLYAFVDGKIVGRLSVRHSLNEYLLHRGGNLGYSVSEPFRKKGYATEILQQGLLFCKKLGLEKVFITCGDENVPSWRIIEKCGGVLENKVFDPDDKEMVRRYWIKI